MEGGESFFLRALESEVPEVELGLGLHILQGRLGGPIQAKSLWKGGEVDARDWEGTYDGAHLSLRRRGLNEPGNETLTFEGDVSVIGNRISGTFTYSLRNQLLNEGGTLSVIYLREGSPLAQGMPSTNPPDTTAPSSPWLPLPPGSPWLPLPPPPALGPSGSGSPDPGLTIPPSEVPSSTWQIPLIGGLLGVVLLVIAALRSARAKLPTPQDLEQQEKEWCTKAAAELAALHKEWERRKAIGRMVGDAMREAARFNGVADTLAHVKRTLDDAQYWLEINIKLRSAVYSYTAPWEWTASLMDRIPTTVLTALAGWVFGQLGSIPGDKKLFKALTKVLGTSQRAQWVTENASGIGGILASAQLTAMFSKWRDEYLVEMMQAIADARVALADARMKLQLAAMQLAQVKLTYGAELIIDQQMRSLRSQLMALRDERWRRCHRFNVEPDAFASDYPYVPNDWQAQRVGYDVTPPLR
jgi:hypothetical protein